MSGSFSIQWNQFPYKYRTISRTLYNITKNSKTAVDSPYLMATTMPTDDIPLAMEVRNPMERIVGLATYFGYFPPLNLYRVDCDPNEREFQIES
jgi:hypothetical protein